MGYLLIFICALLSCTKVTIQGNVAKGNIKNILDSAIANCLVFFFVSLIFSISLRKGINTNGIVYSVVFGVLSASFQIFYAMALQSGPFSATCMIVNLSMVMPVVFSVIYFNEKLTIVKIIGVLLCFLALFLNTRSDGKKFNFKWLLYAIFAFVSTGGIGITQKLFAKLQNAGDVEQFVFWGYLVAFLVSLIVVIVLKRTDNKRNMKMNPKNIILLFFIAATLGTYQYFNTFANSFVDAIVLNPSISGLSTSLQMLSGRIVFKERFTLRQKCSICIGIAAILIISM